ncbi:histidine kinase [Ktedonobacter sp. SOSP1-52]|uniref:sensor histidine kinase n=1 Tax=Ktedonobacter sp. SOSP1-52 TaxID=2778366 RepID=UPI0019161C1E|nr:sensor histidine kinase [Ktedonobacter sp. SOSP1-52]GHO70015.1 histidine kinase [Ktedonobacter sp. SOSP1-52]
MTNMLFHLFSKKEGKKPEQQDQQKRSPNWFLLFWLGFIYVQYMLPRVVSLLQKVDEKLSFVPSVEDVSQKDGRSGILLALFVFTLLMAFHSGLHWSALFRNIKRPYLWLYFPLQIVCILLIYLMTDGVRGSDDVLLGLCLMLAIEAIILFKRISLIIVAAAGCLLFYLAIQGLNLLIITQQDLPAVPKLIGVLTESSALIPFVCASVILYIQQTRAHQRDQILLRDLETAHIQLEDYAARVQDLTLTTERQRMARELHDTLAQGLVGLTMQLETIDSLLIRQRCEQARTIVQQAMTRSRATITSARSAITDLRTEISTTRDILVAIEAEAEHFTMATGIPCPCSLETRLPDEYYEHLLRMVSEGLTNIARHAQANQAWIRASVENEAITLEIGDNGVGFESAKITTGHYGLLGLRERARLMNGQLLVSSKPGKGTTVRLCLPLQRGGEDERKAG